MEFIDRASYDAVKRELSSKNALLSTREAEIAALREALQAVAKIGLSDGLYETEYDGRMYTVCQGCDYQDDVRPRHAAHCKYLAVSKLVSAALSEPKT